LANTTVSHSQIATVNVNHAGSLPPPSELPPKSWMTQAPVVISAPISTTNMTGLRIWIRGSSLASEATIAGRTMSALNREERCEVIELPGRGRG
jgi:hypothetical protein